MIANDYCWCRCYAHMYCSNTVETKFLFLALGSRRREKNKGIGAEVVHYLGDGLYQSDEI
jgi:hypothetical protein